MKPRTLTKLGRASGSDESCGMQWVQSRTTLHHAALHCTTLHQHHTAILCYGAVWRAWCSAMCGAGGVRRVYSAVRCAVRCGIA